jgi:hypothetical protein
MRAVDEAMSLRVCDECVRAVALIGLREGVGLDTSFNTIARHPEAGTDCALCGRGPGQHAAEDFARLVVERRPEGATFAQAMRQWRSVEDDR